MKNNNLLVIIICSYLAIIFAKSTYVVMEYDDDDSSEQLKKDLFVCIDGIVNCKTTTQPPCPYNQIRNKGKCEEIIESCNESIDECI